MFFKCYTRHLVIIQKTKSRDVFFISAYRTKVFIGLQFPASVLMQSIIFVQKKNDLNLQIKFGKIQCLMCGEKSFCIKLLTLSLKIAKSGGF